MTPEAWGYTVPMLDERFLATEACFAFAGGYSSLHYHEAKRNSIYVNFGILSVVTFNSAGVNIESVVGGQSCHVDRFIPHYFLAIAPSQFIQFYTGEVESGDTIHIAEAGICADIDPDELKKMMREEYGKFRSKIKRP
jgi:hypothetical protein